MKSLTEHLWFETPHRRDYINITGTVEQLVGQLTESVSACWKHCFFLPHSVGPFHPVDW
jgi:hypothetical protein